MVQVDVREKLSIPSDEADGFLAELLNRRFASEALVLSTCNRTELYCLSAQPELVRSMTVTRGGHNLQKYEDLFYVKRGRDMIKHAFAVASGLDSMILGEPEILGQMKKAFTLAHAAGFTGPHLTKLFERTFNVAKKVRSETAVGREVISVPALCTKLARDIFGDLSECTALCIGAGTIIETAVEYLTNQSTAAVTISNRTLHNAEVLAQTHGANLLPYEDITHSLHRFDIIITATSSVLPVIGKGALERSCEMRKRRPMAIFDLAVPRDVEPEANRLEDLFLYSIDDIGKIASVNMDKRRAAANDAQAHISKATENLVSWYERLGTVAIIKDLRQRLDILRDKEVAKAHQALANGKDPDAVLRMLAHRLTNRLANDPLHLLASQHPQGEIVDEINNWYKVDE